MGHALGDARVLTGACILALATLVVFGLVVLRSDDDSSPGDPVHSVQPGQAGRDCSATSSSALPRLPAKFRSVAATAPGGSATPDGASVRRLLEDGRQVGVVLSTPVPVHGGSSPQALLDSAERSLRANGTAPERIAIGPFPAVSVRLRADRGHQVITQGSCRTFSVIGIDARSTRGLASVLLDADVAEAAGRAEPAP